MTFNEITSIFNLKNWKFSYLLPEEMNEVITSEVVFLNVCEKISPLNSGSNVTEVREVQPSKA